MCAHTAIHAECLFRSFKWSSARMTWELRGLPKWLRQLPLLPHDAPSPVFPALGNWDHILTVFLLTIHWPHVFFNHEPMKGTWALSRNGYFGVEGGLLPPARAKIAHGQILPSDKSVQPRLISEGWLAGGRGVVTCYMELVPFQTCCMHCNLCARPREGWDHLCIRSITAPDNCTVANPLLGKTPD